MLYFNHKNGAIESKEVINAVMQCRDIESVKRILSEHGIDFASIRFLEDESLEIIHGNDYVLIGPCGGIYETWGKYEKYDCFDYDMDEFDAVIQNDIKFIMSGSIPVINLGQL